MLMAALTGIAGAQGTEAAAQLEDTDGNPVGTAEFVEEPNGVAISVNLEPGQQAVEPGEHGIHLHTTGSTSPDFDAAGKHFNPTSAQHGFDNSEGPHAGDLENITVNDDGSASYQTTAALATLSGGQNALLDSDGSALVIHAQADDYQTDPTGESGDRVAAGVIRASASGESTVAGGTTTGGPLPKSGGVTPSAFLPAAALILGSGILAFAVLRRR